MTDEFALVDFALVRAHPGDVVLALAAHADRSAGSPAPAPKARRPGLIGRLFGTGRAAHGGLSIHPAGHLPPAPLSRAMPDDLGFAAGQTPFRVTAPLGSEALTLVEFRESDGALSPIAAGLSSALAGAEVFYFRLSGLRHPGSETVFHIYRDGAAQRRASSICADGILPEAEWDVVDAGLPHLVEADSLPSSGARAWEIMTPERQGAILAAMGIEPDTLFSADPGQDDDARVTFEISAEPDGRPLSEAKRIYDRARASHAAARTDATDPKAEAERNAGPDPAAVPAPTHPPAAQPGRIERPPARPPKASAPAKTEAPAPAPKQDQRDERWETEVTRLLVTAVAHALPEEEQVPWLTELTARLEAGDVEDALAEAQQLIQRGNRPASERHADAARLNELFGIAPVSGAPPRPPNR